MLLSQFNDEFLRDTCTNIDESVDQNPNCGKRDILVVWKYKEPKEKDYNLDEYDDWRTLV